jgi:hypothetical protein
MNPKLQLVEVVLKKTFYMLSTEPREVSTEKLIELASDQDEGAWDTDIFPVVDIDKVPSSDRDTIPVSDSRHAPSITIEAFFEEKNKPKKSVHVILRIEVENETEDAEEAVRKLCTNHLTDMMDAAFVHNAQLVSAKEGR